MAAPARAAVSARRMRRPRDTASNPACRMPLSSPSVQPPAGPTTRRADAGGPPAARRHDVPERPAAVLAQKEPPVRAGIAQELLERPGRMDLCQEGRLALFGRLPNDPLPPLELPVRPLAGVLERPRADDRDDLRAAELGGLLDDGLELLRFHQARGQGDPRPGRLGPFHGQNRDLGPVVADPFDAGQAAAAVGVDEPDLLPRPDPGRPGQVAMFLAGENDEGRVLGDERNVELVGGHAFRRLTAGCSSACG